jgi:hypothetical protein
MSLFFMKSALSILLFSFAFFLSSLRSLSCCFIADWSEGPRKEVEELKIVLKEAASVGMDKARDSC